MAERKLAKNLALKRLSKQSLHSQELKTYLSKKGISSEVIEETISFFKELSYIADEEWLERFVVKEQQKGKSTLEIRAKLRGKGIAFHHPSRGEEGGALRHCIEKKYPVLLEKNCEEKAKKKAIDALLRRGFSFELIQSFLYTLAD